MLASQQRDSDGLVDLIVMVRDMGTIVRCAVMSFGHIS